MLRLKITSVEDNSSAQKTPSQLFDYLSIEAFYTKEKKNQLKAEFSEENLKSNYILISEKDFNEKMSARNGKKSNPLMLNFEDYSD